MGKPNCAKRNYRVSLSFDTEFLIDLINLISNKITNDLISDAKSFWILDIGTLEFY